MWPPFCYQDWWLIIRLERNLPAVLDDKMRENIINMMYEEWINQQIFPLINQLRASSKESKTQDAGKNNS